MITVGFFFSWGERTGLLGTGGAVDLQTVGWEVINQGGEGLVVVLVVDAEIQNITIFKNLKSMFL